jgi:hypothetical protein
MSLVGVGPMAATALTRSLVLYRATGRLRRGGASVKHGLIAHPLQRNHCTYHHTAGIKTDSVHAQAITLSVAAAP